VTLPGNCWALAVFIAAKVNRTTTVSTQKMMFLMGSLCLSGMVRDVTSRCRAKSTRIYVVYNCLARLAVRLLIDLADTLYVLNALPLIMRSSMYANQDCLKNSRQICGHLERNL